MNDFFSALGDLFGFNAGGGAAAQPQGPDPVDQFFNFFTAPGTASQNTPQKANTYSLPHDITEAVTAPFDEPAVPELDWGPVEAILPSQVPKPVPAVRPAPERATTVQREMPPPSKLGGPPQLVSAPKLVRSYGDAARDDNSPKFVSRTPPRGEFEEYAPGSPFAIPKRDPAPGGASGYKGTVYPAMNPDDTIQVEGLNILNGSVPGNTYSNTAKPEPWKAIVFHHTSSKAPTANQIAGGQSSDKARGGKFGYHFYVDTDGTIIQGAPLSARTNHVQTSKGRTAEHDVVNGNAIGISLIGDGKNPTPEQNAAALKLGKALETKFNITRAYGHGEIQGKSREATEGLALARALRGE